MNVSVRDESEAALPLLTRAENALVTASALAQQAADGTGSPSSIERAVDIWAVVSSRVLRQPAGPEPADRVYMAERVGRAALHRLLIDPKLAPLIRFIELLRLAASNSTIWMPIAKDEAGERHIVKVEYDEPQRLTGGFARRLGTSLGWTGYTMWVALPHSWDVRSYHLEVSVPPDIRLRRMRVTQGGTPLHGQDQDIDQRVTPRRSHFYASGEEAERGGVGHGAHRRLASLTFGVERRGTLSLALAFAAAIAATVTGFWLFVDEAIERPQAASALLLIFPAVLTLLLSRINEHPLASIQLNGVRALVLIAAACAAANAFALAIWGPDDSGKSVASSEVERIEVVARISMYICWLITALLLRSWAAALATRKGRRFLLFGIALSLVLLALGLDPLIDRTDVSARLREMLIAAGIGLLLASWLILDLFRQRDPLAK